MSRQPGDGGLSPGRLVFSDELEKFSGAGMDVILEDITGGRAPESVNLGGPAIVSLVAAAQLLHGTGARISFYGAKGDDENGKVADSLLQELPVNTDNYRILKGLTPDTTVFSDPSWDAGRGERIFVNNIGAAGEFGPGELDDGFFSADILCYGATALVPQIHDNLLNLLWKGKERGRLNLVNTVYDFRSELQRPGQPWLLGEDEESFQYIDVLITDREEALKISGKSDMMEAMEFYRENGTGTVIITQGAEPVQAFSDGSVFRSVDRVQLPVSDAVCGDVLLQGGPGGDTTGCGDNFAGGVLASLAMQLREKRPGELDLMEACSWGVCTGGATLFHHGGTYRESFPGEKRDKVCKYLLKYKEQMKDNYCIKPKAMQC
jgi:sugar/nucleoside kinase (ribokinase family)